MHLFYSATRIFLTLILFAATASAAQPQFLILTASGDTSFYARPGDTVGVRVHIESGTDLLTGVELYLGWDSRIFQAIDVGEGKEIQPSDSGELLGDVLVNALIDVSDTVSVAHYAETNLSGRAVSGDLFGFSLHVVGRHSGRSPIEVYRDDATKRISQYSVPNAAGVTQELTGVGPLHLEDLPPGLALPDSLETQEDETLLLKLDDLAWDEEPPDSLRWTAEALDSLTQVSISATGSHELQLSPARDFFGLARLRLTVADPAGGATAAEVPVRVFPVNDGPRVVPQVLPDTLRLETPFLTILVGGAAEDVDDPSGDLLWSATGADSVMVSAVADGIRVASPRAWAGTRHIVLRVTDPSGAADSARVVVLRALPLGGMTGDFNGDDEVGFSDFLQFVPHYGTAVGDAAYDVRYDLNGDGRVDFVDFLEFAGVYG